MNRREFIARLGGAASVGHAARLLFPVNGVLVADHMAYRADHATKATVTMMWSMAHR
jgi:hypothetical protein